MNLSIRSFDPELPFSELARPVSATEISERALSDAIESRAGRGGGETKALLNQARTRDPERMLRNIAAKRKAEQKWKKREERRRAK